MRLSFFAFTLRPTRKWLSLAGLTALLLLSPGCEKLGFKKVEKVERRESLTFPITRTIRDTEGRELEVTLLGRSSDEIIIERTSDNKRFALAIERLSDLDQAFVKTLPVKAAPVTEAAAPAQPPGTPRYIEVRLGDIEKLEAEIESLQDSLTDQELDPVEINSRRRGIRELENRAEGYRQDIEIYKRNNQL